MATCGHCKSTNVTVDHVRTCAQPKPAAPAADGLPPRHQTPCVCGTYDRCYGVRVRTARTYRDVFRSYCD